MAFDTRSGISELVESANELVRTARLLTDVLNMKRVRDYASPDGEHRIEVFSMATIGGLGSLGGALIGAFGMRGLLSSQTSVPARNGMNRLPSTP